MRSHRNSYYPYYEHHSSFGADPRNIVLETVHQPVAIVIIKCLVGRSAVYLSLSYRHLVIYEATPAYSLYLDKAITQ